MVHEAEAAHARPGVLVPVFADVAVGLGDVAGERVVGERGMAGGRGVQAVVVHYDLADGAQGTSAVGGAVGVPG